MRIFRIGQRVRRTVNDSDVPLGTLGTVVETPFGWTAPGDDEVYVNFDGYYQNPYRALEDCIDHASVDQSSALKTGDYFKLGDGVVHRAHAVDDYGNVAFVSEGIMHSCSIMRAQKMARAEVALADALPQDADDSERLRADNARLAESMAKLEYAIGMMREKIAEQQGIIAEQATELRKLRRAR